MEEKVDANGEVIRNENNEPILEQVYSVATGTVLTINTKTEKLYHGDQELIDISKSLTPQKREFIKQVVLMLLYLVRKSKHLRLGY